MNLCKARKGFTRKPPGRVQYTPRERPVAVSSEMESKLRSLTTEENVRKRPFTIKNEQCPPLRAGYVRCKNTLFYLTQQIFTTFSVEKIKFLWGEYVFGSHQADGHPGRHCHPVRRPVFHLRPQNPPAPLPKAKAETSLPPCRPPMRDAATGDALTGQAA